MPEDTHVIRGINWRETFPFTNIFRSFRVAIHPSKLILALLAILLLYLGGRALDGLWPMSYRGVPNEVDLHESLRAGRTLADVPPEANAMERELAAQARRAGARDFADARKKMRQAVEDMYAQTLLTLKIQNSDGKALSPDEAADAARKGDYLRDVKDQLIHDRDKAIDRLQERHKIERDAAKDGYLAEAQAALSTYYGIIDAAGEPKVKGDAKTARDKALADAKNAQEAKYKDLKGAALTREDKRREDDRAKERTAYENAARDAYARTESSWRQASQIEGEGLFDLFMDYQATRVNGVVDGVLHNNWLGGLAAGGEPSGVFVEVYRFFCVGPRWAFGQHAIFFTLFFILFLIVWALFGGAIARIAAVHVAREEKLSMRQALRFSGGKFLSFVFAPVIPLVIIVVVGLVVAVGGLLLYVPVVGEILVGIFFFLALAAGFVMTLVALGTFGGLDLMYPTIAVEGSDSFDAISRSFSYVYARPWRMLWYTIVAILYGAATFLFVRLFIFLTLAFTHRFVGMWVARTTDGEQSVWWSIWPGSSLWHLPYRIDFISLSFGQKVAAFFVAIWVFLVITFLGAYLISYYFSSSTIIYYLMRREVDATELDDVYMEQSDDEFAEPVTTTGPAGAAVAVSETSVVGTATSMPSAPTEPAAPPPVTPPDGSIPPP